MINPDGTADLNLTVPGPGSLAAEAAAPGAKSSGAKTVVAARGTATASRAGNVKLVLKPTAGARRILRKKGKLAVSVKITFTPTGGTASSQPSRLTLKLKRH